MASFHVYTGTLISTNLTYRRKRIVDLSKMLVACTTCNSQQKWKFRASVDRHHIAVYMGRLQTGLTREPT
jgi:hypothetical protein